MTARSPESSSRTFGTCADVTDAIGWTPLVELSRLTQGLPGRILAKLEYLNPGHSMKDRIAREMISQAEADGSLVPGQTVVELTSGNTGTGLAIVCAVRGYPFVAVMSRGNSVERARMMKAFGAEVVLVDQAPNSPPGQVSGEDLELVELAARELTLRRNAFRADQFHLSGNSDAHLKHTGPEIWEQSRGEVDAFVDFVGTGGSFVGCAKALKGKNPGIRCYVVEPETAAFLAGHAITNRNHRIQGGGYSMELPLLDRSLVDGMLTVSDEAASAASRDLARKEGIFGGISSGAVIAAAIDLLTNRERGSSIALLISDSGLKYLSTDLWN